LRGGKTGCDLKWKGGLARFAHFVAFLRLLELRA
jgi:hypothetical protein